MKKIFLLLTLCLLLSVGVFAQAQRRVEYIQTTTVGIGSVPSAQKQYVSVLEKGQGLIHQTVFTITNMPLTVRDVQQGGGLQIYDFPEGRVVVIGATGASTFTTTSVLASTLNPSVSCRWGVGTTTQANATLATTEQDLLPVTTFTSSATINVVNTSTSAQLSAEAQFDGTSTPKDAFFNVSVPLATDIDADATVLVNGTITITWINVGDV